MGRSKTAKSGRVGWVSAAAAQAGKARGRHKKEEARRESLSSEPREECSAQTLRECVRANSSFFPFSKWNAFL